MEIMQLRIIPHDEVEKDISRASLRIEQLMITLEETGFMDSERSLVFQKMMHELDKAMAEVIEDK